MHRGPFEDALTWFEIHGNAPAVLEHWKGFIEALGPEALHPPAAEPGAPPADGRAPGAAGDAGEGAAAAVAASTASRLIRRAGSCRGRQPA